MSGDVQELPPYRIWPHLQAAFGGVFGTLNLFVGAVSIFRQIVRAFDVGLSPVLKSIFAAYIQIFHGLVDFFAGALSWISGFDLSVPPWAHDWIILWFVGSGAAFRLVIASDRTMLANYVRISEPGGYLLRSLRATTILRLLARDWSFPPRTRSEVLLLTVVRVFQFMACALAWPLVLLEVAAFRTRERSSLAGREVARVSYRALFVLQTLAIILAIFGLSVLNAQTM